MDGHDTGDIDCDGQVGFTDFVLFTETFGDRQQSASAAAVPEPAALAILFPSLMALLAIRRRRV